MWRNDDVPDMSDSEKCYELAKWLSSRKRETLSLEMPDDVLAEYRQLFGEPSASGSPKKLYGIWRDIAPQLSRDGQLKR